ncbi:unnamed protein product [Rotaria magnacalcarata]|uniref:G-protein coupled receptors family 1 profile domain-containing protein n=1 Tax=Rotaria magnacalcarata TaxID=392030 RepID=A0A816VYZ3_9BILA|nr:unnamed protein product [Rotaria magnacalcarata]
MSTKTLLAVGEFIQNSNQSRSINALTSIFPLSASSQTIDPITKTSDISPLACIGFAVLILTTVIGNTLVLAALFLDKRLHTPSFFLIANMAIADLLLGISVLPFSSVLELLNNHWIFGQNFCSAWLALDVLCCTASIIGLAGVSIDRYIGVTRPLKYSSLMTIRRTIYLIIIIWAVSILTSVVPLFGLTDRGAPPKNINSSYVISETCEVNKNTFYTIFSSIMSFYIPVIILLILYSRIYQEAKEQGKKLENEKRRLYEIDYQIAFEHARKQQNQSNGHSVKTRMHSTRSDDTKNDVSSTLLNREHIPDEESAFDHGLSSTYEEPTKKDGLDLQNAPDDDVSHSGISVDRRKSRVRSLIDKSILSTIRKNSILHNSHFSHYNNSMSSNEELTILKHKLHNLRCEKKAFRTVGLILGALLICWFPFFLTLPLMAILKDYEIIKDDTIANTWFKITFWLGYCNSALNPFVYAFSNRAIRRAFREMIFRRFCFCCICQKKSTPFNESSLSRRRGTDSGSIGAEVSKIPTKQANSYLVDNVRAISKKENGVDDSSNKLPLDSNTHRPAVSFADFINEHDPNNDTSRDNQKPSSEFISMLPWKNSTSNSNS